MMWKTYLLERLSWIAVFVCIPFMLLFIAYVDPYLSLSSMLYVVFLLSILFLAFFLIRWRKETNFYQKLNNWEDSLDITELPEAETPFQHIVEKRMREHTEKLQETITRNQVVIDQEKDDLLSWIHEVKTPLTAMHLMISRIDDKELKSLIMYEWLRIHLLLDQQLHQKRLPYMENDVYIEKVDIHSIVSQEIKTLRAWCMQKKIGFEIELDAAEVLSDSKWLAFILRQLLTNAVKYSEASDITVTSYLVKQQVILQVKDTGRGIDVKDLPRIFEKGFTSTRNHRDHAASGMGLYLAKKAAQTLQIEMKVDSEPGEGTVFTLIFPNKNSFVGIQSM